MVKHEVIDCPRCGKVFECKQGSILLCHCSEIVLSREQMAYLSEQWDGCLCHHCLLEIKEQWGKESRSSITDTLQSKR